MQKPKNGSKVQSTILSAPKSVVCFRIVLLPWTGYLTAVHDGPFIVGITEVDWQCTRCIEAEVECWTVSNECSNGSASDTDSCRTRRHGLHCRQLCYTDHVSCLSTALVYCFAWTQRYTCLSLAISMPILCISHSNWQVYYTAAS